MTDVESDEPESAEQVFEELESASPETRRRAVRPGDSLPPEPRRRALVHGLGDPDWRVRREAIETVVQSSTDMETTRSI